MALQRLRNDPEAGWELRKRTPLWSPDFLMMSPDCIYIVDYVLYMYTSYLEVQTRETN